MFHFDEYFSLIFLTCKINIQTIDHTRWLNPWSLERKTTGVREQGPLHFSQDPASTIFFTSASWTLPFRACRVTNHSVEWEGDIGSLSNALLFRIGPFVLSKWPENRSAQDRMSAALELHHHDRLLLLAEFTFQVAEIELVALPGIVIVVQLALVKDIHELF